MMPVWLLELFCPEHGLPILMEALRRYYSVWAMGMYAHRIARVWARRQALTRIVMRFRHLKGV